MFYLIQDNVFGEPRYNELLSVLRNLDLSYEIVKSVYDLEKSINSIRKDTFVYGSVKIAKITAEYDWFPGSFYGGNHIYEKYSEKYRTHLLNFDSKIHKIKENFSWEQGVEKFIKPSRDAKVFTGKNFTLKKWTDFKERIIADENEYLNSDTFIQVSRVKHISKEARIWIVGGKIITSSYYRFHGNIEFEETVSEEGLQFAKKIVDIFCPAEAFVLDICLTPEGWKIVEINCINSAGLYKADLVQLIQALENQFGYER